MLGRYQPWHDGHQALLERALAKHGQVFLMVRDMATDKSNPYDIQTVIENLQDKLVKYAGKVNIVAVPNILNITYGRDVGYKIEQEKFDKEIENISATKIRSKST
jgi:nicotinamide mononucleotide adenylyltransferase